MLRPCWVDGVARMAGTSRMRGVRGCILRMGGSGHERIHDSNGTYFYKTV
jgi:hypothetical protein